MTETLNRTEPSVVESPRNLQFRTLIFLSESFLMVQGQSTVVPIYSSYTPQPKRLIGLVGKV